MKPKPLRHRQPTPAEQHVLEHLTVPVLFLCDQLLKVENAVLIATQSPARWTAYSSDLDGFGYDGEQK
ncbi:MAG: hypothetical protein EXS18_07760 [Verrucomicrobiae bacterium]|nr:hypothetical protein [Verrucomicrobiae bacterium]